MKTKTKMNRAKNWKVSLCTILITGVFLTGSFVAHDEYTKRINVVRSELSATQNELSECENDLKVTQSELEQSQADCQLEQKKVAQLTDDLASVNDELANVKSKLNSANNTINDLKGNEYELVYMGDFKITYYCDERYSHICGGNGITASGKPTEVGVTAAADWSILPKGSKVYIDGVGWREIQDVGGSVNGKHVDVLVQGHNEALSIGTKNKSVWMLIKKG